jgi:RHS repeat-associated protein
LKQKSLHGAVGSGIQNLNYAYNIRGWMEKINNPDVTPASTSTQKLNLGLYYNSVPTGFSCPAQYNGNISSVVWNTPGQAGALSPADKQGYGFTYDGLNRLLTSSYGEGTGFGSQVGANNENLTYDKNGNVLTLVRYKKGTGIIDNLAYIYKSNGSSNQLDRVDDSQTIDNGFTELIKQAGEYGYDLNGNLTSDQNKGFNSIQYNFLNLPRRVGTTSQYISYIYSADGNKLAKVGTDGVVTYYAGSFVYTGSSLTYLQHPEGLYFPSSGGYHYFLKDHLGNTRMMVNTLGTGGTIVQQTDYYPFGMEIASYSSGVENRYRYNGKEKQNDLINGKNLDWYDYGARMYDPTIGRWHSVDPMAEKFFSWSPYVYCLNNPIKLIDPDGKIPTEAEAAAIAAHVYGDKTDKILIGGWQVSNRDFGIAKNDANNGLLSQVYERSVDGKTEFTYATAGTQDKTDALQDAAQVVGLSDQYKESTKNAGILSEKLGSAELTFVGHSLGGGEAALNALVNDKNAITFNAAGVSNITKAENGVLFKSESKINAVIMVTDPLNAAQKAAWLPTANGHVQYLMPKNVSSVINGHSIDNVLKNYNIDANKYKKPEGQ